MSKARDLGNLLNTDGDVKSDSLDNVPTPTKASIEALGIDVPAAKLTGTIADARFPSRLSQSKLSETIADNRLPDPLPAIDGSNLTGVAPTKATIEALGIELPAANLTGTIHADRYTDTVYTHLHTTIVTAMSANDMDLSVGEYFSKTISGNTTLTFSNIPSGYAGWVLEITNGGSATVTWPTNVKWGGGVAASLTASGVDILVFTTDDSGTTIRAGIFSTDSK